MKKSKYNRIINLEDGKVLAFNSVTCALAEVDEDFLHVLNNIDTISLTVGDEKKNTLIKDMMEGNFIVHNNLDEVKLIKYRNYSGKFSKSGLGIVLAPTLACNFACPYCYESPEPGMMSDEIQNCIIDVVEKSAKRKEDVSITWYGGEPLLAVKIIKNFSKKVIEICDRENVSYGAYIVTNGYLLNNENIQIMKEARITGAQVTIDGPPNIHNMRRKLRNSDEPTFDRILDNVKNLMEAGITNIAIRINIDKTNVEQVEELLNILEKKDLKDVIINLGHVTAYTDACSDILESCLNVEEYSEYDNMYQRILHKRGYTISGYFPYYPSIKSNYCCADHIDSFVIDPKGYMYKCWNDVGNIEKSVGNIMDKEDEVDDEMFARNIEYIMWSPFEHEDCVNCDILPICMGGCPYSGMREEKPLCEKWKYSLDNTIISTYNQKVESAEV